MNIYQVTLEAKDLTKPQRYVVANNMQEAIVKLETVLGNNQTVEKIEQLNKSPIIQ